MFFRISFVFYPHMHTPNTESDNYIVSLPKTIFFSACNKIVFIDRNKLLRFEAFCLFHYGRHLCHRQHGRHFDFSFASLSFDCCHLPQYKTAIFLLFLPSLFRSFSPVDAHVLFGYSNNVSLY